MFDPKGEKLNLFGSGEVISPRVVDQEIFGGSGIEIPDSGRVVAKPTPIHEIWADVKQPRRAIPISIRMHWDGNPLDVTPMLGKWHLVAEAAAGQPIDIIKLLNGEGEGLDTDKFPSVAQDYLALVRLAQSIKADGLINPITIFESDGKLLIESGERRWLAYHLLNTYLGDQWAKIPAAKGSGSDSVWRQCTENMSRSQLNAIGKARQFALLVMTVREAAKVSSGAVYKDYEELVTAGTSDRRYYAQIADGNLHRIPPGMAERIQSAMGLSESQLAQYRKLLRLTDDEQLNDILWTQADIENWPETAMREVATFTLVKVRQVVDRANWSLDDLRALKEAASAPPAQPMTPAPSSGVGTVEQLPVLREWIRKNVRNSAGRTGLVINVDGAQIRVVWDDDHSTGIVNYKDLHFTQPRTIAPSAATPQMVNSGYGIGDLVRTPGKGNGEVVSVSGRLIGVKTASGTFNFDYSFLSRVVIDEADIEADVDPDAPPPQREWREGGMEGHSVAVDESDKADSDTAAEPKRIIKFGSLDSKFLFTMQQSAQLVNDGVALATINDIINMTDVQASDMAKAGALQPALDTAYNIVRDMVTGHLALILQQIQNAAE